MRNGWKFFVVIFAFVAVFSGCKAIYRSGFVFPPEQLVSGPIVIGPEWTEIIPSKPLIPYGQRQWITVGFMDYSKKDYKDDVGENLNLANGKKTKVEAFLFDQEGISYELQITGIGGGIDFDRKLEMGELRGEKHLMIPDFPQETTYTKLMIRSEIPLSCDFIKWVGHNSK